jgi:ankyrin repeat protein
VDDKDSPVPTVAVKINEKNDKGYTPLLCAVAADHTECAQLLLSAGTL